MSKQTTKENITKKIKIALFIDTFYPMIDGVVMAVDNYARNLSKFADVTVFTLKARKKFDDSIFPYKVVRSPRIRLYGFDYDLPTPSLSAKFKKEIVGGNFDIIHIHSPFTIGAIGAKFAKKLNIPLIATMHSQYKQDFERATKIKFVRKLLLKNIVKVFNKADILLTMNPACERLAREYGCLSKIELMPNGTTLKQTKKISQLANQIKKNYNITDEKVFISVGRINKLKNIEFSIKVLKILKENNFKYKMFIIGSGQDKNYFENLVKKLNLENEIIFVGKVTDNDLKSAYYMASDLQLFPSTYDTDGIVKIEASAFSVPTIMAKGALSSSNCEDNKNAYIEDLDEEKFAKRIISIFEDEKKYRAVKANCKKDLFVTWQQVTSRVLKKYKNLIIKKQKE